MFWHPQGDYLAVKVDRYTKTRKSAYTAFELFSVKERDIPMEVHLSAALKSRVQSILYYMFSFIVEIFIPLASIISALIIFVNESRLHPENTVAPLGHSRCIKVEEYHSRAPTVAPIGISAARRLNSRRQARSSRPACSCAIFLT